ncbi:unnamed protein product [Toxocara canis]|uniref:Uncharacterized protein n=1 Tax=Toxocara canis TaxID=6265 RepID=A0A183URN9_TOXCA|nr:unnamed protein product [Toxocara canis]
MLSPAMLKYSLTRRTSLREKSKGSNSGRGTLTPVVFDIDDDESGSSSLPVLCVSEWYRDSAVEITYRNLCGCSSMLNTRHCFLF